MVTFENKILSQSHFGGKTNAKRRNKLNEEWHTLRYAISEAYQQAKQASLHFSGSSVIFQEYSISSFYIQVEN